MKGKKIRKLIVKAVKKRFLISAWEIYELVFEEDESLTFKRFNRHLRKTFNKGKIQKSSGGGDPVLYIPNQRLH